MRSSVGSLVRRRIAIVSSREPWRIGGVERVVAETARRLKSDFDVEILCMGGKTLSTEWEDIPVHVFKGYSAMYPLSLSFYRCLKARFCDFDLVHCHNFATFTTLASVLAKNRVVPLVLSPHFNPVAQKSYYAIFRRLHDLILGKRILKGADFVVYGSEAERKLLQCKFKMENRGAVIHTGVDTVKIRSAAPYDLKLGRMVLYLGRLEKSKNVHLLVRSMSRLPQDFSLYIIGEGSYSAQLKKLIDRLNLRSRVTMLGPVYGEDVYRWMKSCCVFVQLSEAESFGLTCVEALAAGKPVLVNDNGTGLTELANLFRGSISTVDLKSQSVHEIAGAIERVCGTAVSPDLNGFDWNDTAQGFKDVYIKLLDRKPPS